MRIEEELGVRAQRKQIRVEAQLLVQKMRTSRDGFILGWAFAALTLTMQNSVPYGPPPPPHLASRNESDQLRPRWQHDDKDQDAAGNRGLAPEVIMADATPSPATTGKDTDVGNGAVDVYGR